MRASVFAGARQPMLTRVTMLAYSADGFSSAACGLQFALETLLLFFACTIRSLSNGSLARDAGTHTRLQANGIN